MKLRITVEGVAYEVHVEVLESDDAGAASTASPAAAPPAAAPRPGGEASGATADVPSPIAGSVLDVKVKVGDAVQADDPLLVLEAMKMESVVSAPRAGTVREILVKPGDAVQTDQVLLRM